MDLFSKRSAKSSGDVTLRLSSSDSCIIHSLAAVFRMSCKGCEVGPGEQLDHCNAMRSVDGARVGAVEMEKCGWLPDGFW